MRILHTSDWHLGRLFHGASLLDEQARAVARIAELAADAEVDVVVVAGDLYDRAIPPSDAVELFDDALLQLRRAGASVVAIAGNHDSAVRVGYGDRLLSEAGVSVRGDASRTGEAVEIPATDGGPPLVVYPVPYLDPLRTAHLAEGDPVLEDATRGDAADGGAAVEGERRRFTHHDAMAWAMARVRADLARRGPARSVVVAHTFLTGGNPSESERELTMGHVEQVRLDVFDGIDYVALGHLHQGQAFDGGRVAYSGSPLPYSFSEQHHTKAVRIVDLGPDGSVEVEVVPLGVGRPLRTLTGELEELLADPSLADAEGAWVHARLTDRRLPLQAMARLQRRFPHAVELHHEPAGVDDTEPTRRSAAQTREADPFELAVEFLRTQRGVEPDDEERRLLADAFEHVRQGVSG